MKENNKIMKKIEQLGKRYCEKYLTRWNKEELEINWWKALEFFFSHSFMRGRPDELSTKYYCFTIKALREYFSITNNNLEKAYNDLTKQQEHFKKEHILNFKRDKNIKGRENSVKHQDFEKEVADNNPVIKHLITPQKVLLTCDTDWKKISLTNDETDWKEISLKNNEDILMVLDVLKFISNNDKKNIYNYLKNKITKSGVKSAYDELREIRGIGVKIASFIIRDILLMNSEIKIADEDYKFAFPIDTWVNKIAHKLGCSSKDIKNIKIKNIKIKNIKNCLIEKCKESGADPLKVAAGLWFLGFHSLDILIEHLGEIEIKGTAVPNSG